MSALTICTSGQFTTVQDLGRFGYGSIGVSSAGAADELSLRVGNRLVGNPDASAALEMTFVGATIRVDAPARIALTGARAPRTTLPMWRALDLGPQDELDIGPMQHGARTYLCIAGGIDIPPVLGSRASHIATGLGPPRCTSGTVLPIGAPFCFAPPTANTDAIDELARELDRHTLRIVQGPHLHRLPPRCLDELLSRGWCINHQSDRIGTRLRGDACSSAAADMPTEGTFHGAIQLPPDGQPIILGPDGAPTGGYPIIASVISVDLPALAQRRPNDAIRFTLVSVDDAQRLARERTDRLNRAIAPIDLP